MITDEELNAALDESCAETITPSVSLQRRVAEIPMRHPRAVAGFWSLFEVKQWWGVATAAAMAMAFGGFSGWTLQEDGLQEEALNGVTAEAETEWEELSALALGTDFDGEWE